MPKEVKLIVDETVALIKNKLLTEKPDTPPKIETLFKECFQVAFTQVEKEEHHQLYKKLSLQFHPDRFQSSQPEIFAYLEQHNVIALAQATLENFKEPGANHFQNMAADPVNGTKNFLYYLWEKFNKMLFEYERYPQPLRLMVNIVHWTIGIAIAAGLIALAIPMAGLYFGIIWPIVKLEKLFVNLITGFQLDAEIENIKNDPVKFAEARKSYIDQARIISKMVQPDIAAQLDARSDDELYKAIIQSKYIQKLQTNFPFGNQTPEQEAQFYKESEAEVEKEIRDTIDEPTGLDKIAIQAQTLANSIASPLPDSAGLGFLQVVFIKPFQVLILPFVLLASVLIETVRLLYTAAVFTAIGAAVALGLAVLAITNLPLYIIDAVNSCSEGCGDSNDDQSDHVNDHASHKGKAPMKDLFDSKYGSEKLQPEPKEQGSYAKLFKSQPSNDSTFDVNQKIESSQPSM